VERRRVSVALTFRLLFGLGLGACAAPAQAQEAGADLYRALEQAPRARVIVALRRPGEPLTELTSRRGAIAAVRARVLSQLGAADFAPTHQWEAVSAVAGEVTASGLAKMMADPDVVRVDLDQGGTVGLTRSLPLIRANEVHAQGYIGRGVVVAVLDSGIASAHPDLRDSLVGAQCFCVNANGTGCCPNGGTQQSGLGSAEDDNGHGTNVTGIVVSQGRVAPAGVAPGAKIVAVKVIDSFGIFASSTQVISGLNWIIMNRPDARVVNMSLGTFALFGGACDSVTAFTMAYADAINTLRARGVTVFVGSGNDASPTLMAAPACVAQSVAVGAVYTANFGRINFGICIDETTAADRVTCFTNSNSTLDLMAPGAPITAPGRGGGTSTFFGTSQASPHAAAAAAVLLEADPALTPARIEATLKRTGVGVRDPKNGLTFPRIDLLAAFEAVRAEAPDLSIVKQASPDPVVGGSTIVYRMTISNRGPSEATAVRVADTLPGSTTYVSCEATGGGICQGSGNNRLITFAGLAPGASAAVTLVARVNCPAAGGAVISNVATVSSLTPDRIPADNSAEAVVTISDPPPVIAGVSVNRPVLQPPNGQLEWVTVNYTATDNCDPAPSCQLRVTSTGGSAPADIGNTARDVQILDEHRLLLRAVGGAGRFYIITVNCHDSAGNSSAAAVTVRVPPD